MNMPRSLLPAALFLALGASAAAAAAPRIYTPLASTGTNGTTTLPLTDIAGGGLVDPVISGDLIYIAAGRVLTTWDYADQTAPVRLADTAATPTHGLVRGLTRWGDHLYASWQAADDTGGVAVYSLADPRNPVLVNSFSDYSFNGYKQLWTLAAANGYLYLFDRENGFFYGDLGANPTHPTFTRYARWNATYDRAQVIGDTLFVSGRTSTLGEPHVCSSIDVSDPGNPIPLDACSRPGADHVDFFRSRVQLPMSVTFGAKLSLFDLSDLTQPVELASIDNDASRDGFIAGNHVYGLGFVGIDIHDITDPTAPTFAAHSDIFTLGAASVTPVEDGALVLTSTDRFTWLDVTDPLAPVEKSVAQPRGGGVPDDIAIVGDTALILQEDYGLAIADAATLEPRGRFEVSLPQQLNQRSIESMAVDGDRAYLAAWGSGLVTVDISNPARPSEISVLPYMYLSAIAAQGDYVYLGTSTNGGYLQVVDVSDPANPQLRGQFLPNTVNRLQVQGDYVYLADELAGLRVIDVSDPDTPTQVALHDGGCMGSSAAFDVALSSDGTRAYLACETGLQVLDITDPTRPATLGRWTTEWASAATVTVRGDRAWFGDRNGVTEIDLSDETRPAALGTTFIVGEPLRRLRAVDDGRVFAFARTAGLHVFGNVAVPLPPEIFADGFEGDAPPPEPEPEPEPEPSVVTIDFDRLEEGFQGESLTIGGVTLRDVNREAGIYADGTPFAAGELGSQLIVENAGFLFNDFPDFGSAPNLLTFGDTFVDGPNLSLGAFSRVWIDLPQDASAAAVDLVFYEWGPWEGIELRLEAWKDGEVVASASHLLPGNGNPGERDRLGFGALALDGAAFDTLSISALLDRQLTAPRLMIDDLTITYPGTVAP